MSTGTAHLRCWKRLPVQRHVSIFTGRSFANKGGGRARYTTAPSSAKAVTSAGTRQRPLHLAIIGSGPAGFYSAYRLLKSLPDARVDMYEQLPSPYGLARYGIAPDHPEAKKCTETLPDVAKYPGFNYIGNVPIGDNPSALPLTSLAPHYDALLFAYGASQDKQLGLPGERLHGVYSARAFVGWYNGWPEHSDLNPDLQSGDTAVVIGQGNVALDVTRMLLSPLADLRQTDMAEHALDGLSRSRIRHVKVIGRRGPLQAPYTIKELRELMNLPGLSFVPPPEGWEALMRVDRKRLPRQLKRIAELLEKGSGIGPVEAGRVWQLGYLRTPVEFLSRDTRTLAAVGFEQTEYAVDDIAALLTADDPFANLNTLRAVGVRGTGNRTVVAGTCAFKSVGYKSEPLAGMSELGIPFDVHAGILPNDRWGRVLSPERGPAGALTAGHVPGMYCAGWVKRGPTGVIASTLDDAFATADHIVRDWREHAQFHVGVGEHKAGWEAVRPEVVRRGIRSVSWADWERIDAEEVRRGREKGKAREKCRGAAEMLAVLDS